MLVEENFGDYKILERDTEKENRAKEKYGRKQKYYICECIKHKNKRVFVQRQLLKNPQCMCTIKELNNKCSIPECNKKVFCHNYCSSHYYLYNTYGDPLYQPEKINKYCSICGISERETRIIKNSSGIYLCRKHYLQLRNVGYIHRTKYDKNDCIEYNSYFEIIIRDNFANEIARCLIDKEDYELIKEFSWHLNDQGYVMSHLDDYNHARIHRLVMNAKDNEIVDHKNHNTLDNRKENLRICTQTNNMQNKGMQSDNTSGVIGVSFYTNLNKWVAAITVNKNKIHLGSFKNFDDAVRARKEAEDKFFGEYKYSPKNDWRLNQNEEGDF